MTKTKKALRLTQSEKTTLRLAQAIAWARLDWDEKRKRLQEAADVLSSLRTTL